MRKTIGLVLFLVLNGVPGIGQAAELKYWRYPFRATSLTGAYVSVIERDRQLEIWREANPEEQTAWRRLVVQKGPSLERRGERRTVLDASLIDDVYDPQQPAQASSSRIFTRSTVNYHAGSGYTLLAGVIHDYQPGKLPLLPALFFSANGAPATWRYLGQLAGEPAVFAAREYVWSDGGSVFRLDDGSWRIYLNGYGVTLSMLTAETFAGPWRFLRTIGGDIQNLAAVLDEINPHHRGYAFPAVVRVNDREWHAWLSEGWPGVAIWHLWSTDGIHWQLYGEQPEITRAAVAGRAFKNIRVYVRSDGHSLIGLLSVWDRMSNGEDGWVLYRSQLRSGPPSDL
jgi:hypothetical protein